MILSNLLNSPNSFFIGGIGNFSFGSLFISMFFFWVNASSFLTQKSGQNDPLAEAEEQQISDCSPLLAIAPRSLKKEKIAALFPEGEPNQRSFLGDYVGRAIWGARFFFISILSFQNWPVKTKQNMTFHLGNLGMFFSNIALFLLLLLRWKTSGHFPLGNLYESLLFLSWSSTFCHFVILNFYFDRKKIFISQITGCITSPCALFANAFASFSLPEEMQKIAPLVPALQSNWLAMHVTVMILSYSACLIGSLLSIAYLVMTSLPAKRIENSNELIGVLNIGVSSQQAAIRDMLEPQGMLRSKSPKIKQIAKTLDNLSYRILGIGFSFLTIGILSGAVWANEAWGSYWSWDAKETWAFLTWLIFAIYLHTRISKGWEGRRPAIIASIGFIVIWICYLGVNLLGAGLHSYGFFA
jgi:cytochrome c-type biogenesis protein CcsB